MGYDSKAILDDIHKADPLPSKGKIDKKTKKNGEKQRKIHKEKKKTDDIIGNYCTKIKW